ncbi:MAG: hypothetical protein R6V77_01095 [Candidatus Cloacimonadaceae bacterium]
MGILPEREPIHNKYENPDEASPLNIERKEVVTPVLTQFKAQVTDDQGNNVIKTPESEKIDIVIPASSEKDLEIAVKGDKSESSVWSAGYWLRMFKKAVYYSWKVLFDGGKQ